MPTGEITISVEELNRQVGKAWLDAYLSVGGVCGVVDLSDQQVANELYQLLGAAYEGGNAQGYQDAKEIFAED